jgi:hypothetical protein
VNRDLLEPVKRSVLSAFHDVAALRDYPETFTDAKRKEIADHAAKRLEDAFRALGFTDQDLWNEMGALQGCGVLEDWTGPHHMDGHN